MEIAQDTDLQDFFDSTRDRIRHKEVKKWDEELRIQQKSKGKSN